MYSEKKRTKANLGALKVCVCMRAFTHTIISISCFFFFLFWYGNVWVLCIAELLASICV